MLKKLSPVLLMLFGHQGASAAQLHAVEKPQLEQPTQAQTQNTTEDAHDDGLDEENFLITNTEIGTRRSVTSRSRSSNAAEAMKGNNDTGYRGKQTRSRTGKRCTAWKDSVTHTPKLYPNAGLDKNFCRNPAPDEDAKTIWCFIEGGTPLHYWEYCDPLGGKDQGSVSKGSVTINSGGSAGGKGVPPNTKIQLTKCQQASPYGNNSYPCSNAFDTSGSKFTHTNRGVGMWWRAQFGQMYWVDRVRIRNRRDCCGNRLAGVEVFIGGEKCGKVEAGTSNGKWYEVKCQQDIRGNQIELKTTRNEYLSISGIEVYSGEDEGDDDEEEGEEFSVEGPATKLTLTNASMNKPYSASSYKAEWALEAGAKRTAIAAIGVGNWWKASFGDGDSVVEKVRIRNRHDCCGQRIAGTKVTVDGQLCGTIPSAGNGAWIEVKCTKPLKGKEIQLTTTRRDYLQINAVEPYGWSMSKTTRRSRTRTTTSSTRRVMPMRRMRMGGFGGMMRGRQLSFKMGNTQVTLNKGSASQSSPYGNNGYPASNAFSGGSKFTHTNRGVGMTWKCGFQGGDQWVWKVRVLNRRDCCGQRLKGTQISIGGQVCGTITQNTSNGQWYEVKCAKPVRGNDVLLKTTQNDYLSISGIEVYSAQCQGNGCGGVTTTTSTSRRMMRMGGMGGMMRGMTKKRQPPVFKMTGSKAKLVSAEQGNKYHPTSYGAENALKNDNSFTHTQNKVGQWWKAKFAGGEQWVWKVRVQNRVDCCGGRLRGVKISIGGQECGQINQPTQNGQWYEVQCQQPLRGDKVILETTRPEYLSITRIEVYTATLSGGAMMKSITKNVRYDKFNNFCVSDKGKDLPQTKINGKNNLNACLAACAMNHLKCSAAEYYAKGWNGSNCYHILTGLDSNRAAKGSPGKRWRDATCYVRS